jgi:DNA-binding NarL/FixJ family response regulator
VVDGIGPEGDLARASDSCLEALAIFRELGHAQGLEAALNWQADLAFRLGDLARSLASAREALGMPRLDPWSSDYLDRVANIAAQSGQPEAAARLYGAADEQRERAGRPVEPAFVEAHLARVDVARQALGEAAFDAAYAAGHALTQPRAEAEAMAFSLPVSAAPPIALTAREAELLPLLAAGRSNADIAGSLFLSVRTVERHVAGLFATLGVHSRADAVAVARAAGLLAATLPDTSGPDPSAGA